jgi:hypothetical protein
MARCLPRRRFVLAVGLGESGLARRAGQPSRPRAREAAQVARMVGIVRVEGRRPFERVLRGRSALFPLAGVRRGSGHTEVRACEVGEIQLDLGLPLYRVGIER